MKKFVLFAFLLCSLTACQFVSQKETNDPIEELLSQMTLEEKIGQLHQIDGGYISEDIQDQIRAGKIGSLLNCGAHDVNRVQQLAVHESRLGIPLLLARDVIHGYKTIFPIPLGQAATFHPALVREAAHVAAVEASSDGIRYTFAPMIDISRDPRWGRVAECLGEDPYLTSVLGVAMIEGFQGKDLSSPQSLAACAKHFAGYGFTEGGRDYNSVDASELRLRETILPPFQAAAQAGVATFMTAFNELNGVPCSASSYLLQTLLRQEWGWKGMVISDYYSIEQMRTQTYSASMREAAKASILAGVDMDMMSFAYHTQLDSLVRSGEVPERVIDQAVRRVLQLKWDLGLFQKATIDTVSRDSFYLPAHLALAQKTAEESVVLLKNDHKLLPLSPTKTKIAVMGPLAHAPADQIGTWCFDGEPQYSITPWDALQEAYGSQLDLTFLPTLTHSRSYDVSQFEKAQRLAKQSDVVLLFLGEEAILSGEAKCRANLNLPGAQTQLLQALAQTGTPIVTIIMAGRPLTLEKEVDLSQAVLFSFHGGTMVGPALVDLLFGKANPSGKLPMTFPKMVGQIPIYYNQKPTGRPPHTYTLMEDIPVGAAQTSLGFTSYWLDAGVGPLFPFGYGLSYTQFCYSDLQLEKDTLRLQDTLRVSCQLENVGLYPGAEVVQLYVHDEVASLMRPEIELKGFQKIFLKKGEKKKITFELPVSHLAYWTAQHKREVEPGTFSIYVSPNSSLENSMNQSLLILP